MNCPKIISVSLYGAYIVHTYDQNFVLIRGFEPRRCQKCIDDGLLNDIYDMWKVVKKDKPHESVEVMNYC